MTTTLFVAVLGAGFGYGLYRLVKAAAPRTVPLPVALEELARRRPSVAELAAGAGASVGGGAQLAARAQRFAVSLLEATGLVDMGVVERKLRIIGRPVEVHATHKILGAVFGLTLGAMAAVALPAGGVAISPAVIVSVALVLGVAGWVYPDLPLNDEVEQRQASFRHALSSYIDLVSSDLAGGIGLETALNSAADAGDGWVYAEIRAALTRARLTGRPVWEEFDQLGTAYGIEELRAVAASAQLAGDQGAQIRESLAIKAESLRTAQLAAIRAIAESASTKMQLPSVLFVAGLVVFLLFGILSIDTTLAPTEINVVTGL